MTSSRQKQTMTENYERDYKFKIWTIEISFV